MTYKEWTAAIEIAGAIVIGAWVLLDLLDGGLGDGSVAGTAVALLWAVGAVIVFNIATTIVVTILVSIARREAFKDEKADERDRAVIARGARNGYVVGSIGAVAGLIALALGADPTVGALVLFAAPMLAGVTDAVSRLVYYRVG